MSEALETERQEAPGVSPMAVAIPVLAIFVIAALVMAILVGAFWIRLGILPTNMAGLVESRFPAPRLQIDPLGDLLANRARAERQLNGQAASAAGGAEAATAAEARPAAPGATVPEPADAARTPDRGPSGSSPSLRPAMPIEAAMARIAARFDPYAPLLPESDVPDSAGRRAMAARDGARSGAAARATVPVPGSNGVDPAGARTDAMAPPAQMEAPSSAPGLVGRKVRVPAESLQGTPTYGGTRDEGAVTR